MSQPESPGNSSSAASQNPVVVTSEGSVSTVTLARPAAMNSLTIETKVALRDAVISLAEDPSVRCVVLTGTGRAFCVGQDLKEHVELLAEGSDALFTTVPEHYNPTVQAVATMAKPVVAAINGVAAGAGASLALASDLRVMSEDAGFNFAFAGIALSCDTGASWTLPRLVGTAKAIELLYNPRTIGAAECLELGLVTEVVPAADLAARAAAVAAKLAAGPTLAYGAIRQSVAYSASNDFTRSLAYEAEKMSQTGRSEDHRNAVHSFVNKQKPAFKGR